MNEDRGRVSQLNMPRVSGSRSADVYLCLVVILHVHCPLGSLISSLRPKTSRDTSPFCSMTRRALFMHSPTSGLMMWYGPCATCARDG